MPGTPKIAPMSLFEHFLYFVYAVVFTLLTATLMLLNHATRGEPPALNVSIATALAVSLLIPLSSVAVFRRLTGSGSTKKQYTVYCLTALSLAIVIAIGTFGFER